MFNMSRMLSIRFGEKLFCVFSSTNPTADVFYQCIPVQSGATQCSSSATTAWLATTRNKTVNCKFEMLLTFYLYFSPTPPLWQIYIFEIMSVFNYQNQYKNSSMLLDVKSRLVMHYAFKCTFLPSFYIIKIFLKLTSRQGV